MIVGDGLVFGLRAQPGRSGSDPVGVPLAVPGAVPLTETDLPMYPARGVARQDQQQHQAQHENVTHIPTNAVGGTGLPHESARRHGPRCGHNKALRAADPRCRRYAPLSRVAGATRR
jgi:hypothetical protein